MFSYLTFAKIRGLHTVDASTGGRGRVSSLLELYVEDQGRIRWDVWCGPIFSVAKIKKKYCRLVVDMITLKRRLVV